MTTDGDKTVSSNPTPTSSSRKVSIITDQGHDNPLFESRSRKVSANSEHADIGPVRKKSILHNAQNNKEVVSGLEVEGKNIVCGRTKVPLLNIPAIGNLIYTLSNDSSSWNAGNLKPRNGRAIWNISPFFIFVDSYAKFDAQTTVRTFKCPEVFVLIPRPNVSNQIGYCSGCLSNSYRRE